MASMSGEKLHSLRPWRPKLHFLFKAATDNNSFSQKINKVPLISNFTNSRRLTLYQGQVKAQTKSSNPHAYAYLIPGQGSLNQNMVCLRCCFVNKTKVSLLSTLLMSISERGVLSSPLSSRLTSSTQRFANWERWWPRSARQPFSRALKNSPPVCTPLLKAVLASTPRLCFEAVYVLYQRGREEEEKEGGGSRQFARASKSSRDFTITLL